MRFHFFRFVVMQITQIRICENIIGLYGLMHIATCPKAIHIADSYIL